MILKELFEAAYSPDLLLYHFCTGESLRAILATNVIKSNTSHSFDGKVVSGISLTRDRSLNLLKTYAISGQRGFRIGLNARELQLAGHRLLPIRDSYLQQFHKAHRMHSQTMTNFNYGVPTKTDSNEAEEFLIPRQGAGRGPHLSNALKFITEIAADNRIISRNRYDDDNENFSTFNSIIAGTFGESKGGGIYRIKHGNHNIEYDLEIDDKPIKLPPHIKFIETHEDYLSKYNDFQLTEGVNDHFLYHSTYLDNALQIIYSDRLEARTDHRVAGRPGFRPKDINQYNRVHGVSLTRAMEFASQWRSGTVIFKIDAKLLRQNHRLVPFDYYNNRREAEEFLIGSLEPLSKYLVAIIINKEIYDYCVEHDECPEILNHPKLQLVD